MSNAHLTKLSESQLLTLYSMAHVNENRSLVIQPPRIAPPFINVADGPVLAIMQVGEGRIQTWRVEQNGDKEMVEETELSAEQIAAARAEVEDRMVDSLARSMGLKP